MRQYVIDGDRVRVMDGMVYPDDVWFMRKKNRYTVGCGGVIINDGTRPIDRLFYERVYSQMEGERLHPEMNTLTGITKFYAKG